MKNKAEEYYLKECNTPSDINEHLPTLRRLADECDKVVEMGTRWVVSTWAFLCSECRVVTMLDLQLPDVWDDGSRTTPCKLEEVEEAAPDKDVYFIEASSLEVELQDVDLLFIDTWHCYEQLKAELERHHQNVNKYIVLHDVELFKHVGENHYGDRTKQYLGLERAWKEFLEDHPEWEVAEWHTNNNGLGVLRRKNG